jgi:hypothetical protein
MQCRFLRMQLKVTKCNIDPMYQLGVQLSNAVGHVVLLAVEVIVERFHEDDKMVRTLLCLMIMMMVIEATTVITRRPSGTHSALCCDWTIMYRASGDNDRRACLAGRAPVNLCPWSADIFLSGPAVSRSGLWIPTLCMLFQMENWWTRVAAMQVPLRICRMQTEVVALRYRISIRPHHRRSAMS